MLLLAHRVKKLKGPSKFSRGGVALAGFGISPVNLAMKVINSRQSHCRYVFPSSLSTQKHVIMGQSGVNLKGKD